jgi:hypothetical protein
MQNVQIEITLVTANQHQCPDNFDHHTFHSGLAHISPVEHPYDRSLSATIPYQSVKQTGGKGEHDFDNENTCVF